MGNTEFGDVHVDVKCERRVQPFCLPFGLLFFLFQFVVVALWFVWMTLCMAGTTDDLVQGGQHSDSSICAYADLSHSRALPFFCS